MNTPQEFAPLLAALRGLPTPQGAALVTLTQTSGSTFRRAGARMLVYGDGRLVRGLSGGCPERDIAAHARQVIASGVMRRVQYSRQHNFDVMVEMGCGGELEVLIEPLREAADWRFAEGVAACLAARETGTLATLLRDGAQPLQRPRRLLIHDAGTYDELADPALSAAIRSRLQGLPAGFKPRIEMIGDAEVMLESLQAPLFALIAGINATSLALARLLLTLGWEVQLTAGDDSARIGVELPQGAAFLHCAPSRIGELRRYDKRSFAVVITHNLGQDIEYLQALKALPLAYLGAIGARQRAARLFEGTGMSATQLRAPAGLDIGSETPEEIALAIAAEMLAVANGHDGGALSAHGAPIHR